MPIIDTPAAVHFSQSSTAQLGHGAQVASSHPGADRSAPLSLPKSVSTGAWPTSFAKLMYVHFDATADAVASPGLQRRTNDVAPHKASAPQLTSTTTERSQNVAHRIFAPWSDPQASLVYNLDFELDDIQRLNHVLTTWSGMPEHARAELVIVAGQRTGGQDTFSEALDFISQHLTDDGQGILQRGDLYQGRGWSVVRGAPLKKASPQQIAEATSRLMAVLGDRPYVFHNNTSEVLFAALPQTFLRNCLAHVCTCDLILTPKGPINGANQRWEPEAYQQSIAACAAAGTPFVGVHGSTLGFGRQTLSQLPNWSSVLKEAVADPTYSRQQIRFSMQQATKWSARIVAAIEGKQGAQVSAQLGEAIDAAVAEQFGKDAPWSVQAWAAQAADASSFDAPDCTLELALKRAHAVAENLDCPINNTIGDYAATLLDGPSAPKDLLFAQIELQVDHKGKPASIQAGVADSSRYLALNGQEDELLRAYTQAHCESRVQSAAGVDIVDTTLAREWLAFSTVVRATIKRGLESANKLPSDADGVVEKLQTILDACDQSLMTRISSDKIAKP